MKYGKSLKINLNNKLPLKIMMKKLTLGIKYMIK